jgi:hypothetical protein
LVADGSFTKDVVILRWPEQADRLDELERLGIPRLLLVEPQADPPVSTSCIEDWLRLPVDDASLRARLVALAAHAQRHPTLPALDEYGQLSYRGEAVFLSTTEQKIAEVLIEHFARVVNEATLLQRSHADGCNDQTLRVNVSRLRRRIAPLGLAITCVRGHGYSLQPESGAIESAHAPTSRPGPR